MASAPELGTAEEFLSRSPGENDAIIRTLSGDRLARVKSEASTPPDGFVPPDIQGGLEMRSVAASNKRIADQIAFTKGIPGFLSFRTWNYRKFPQFIWSTDFCSTGILKPISVYYDSYFEGPCVRHDFGYRNYGKGEISKLRLDPTEAGRKKVDDQLYTDCMFVANGQTNPALRR